MCVLLRQAGFTLIELMVTVAVVAILAMVAAPNMTSFLDRNRVVGAAEAVLAQVQLARTEAVKQGANVTVVFTSGSDWCVGFARGDAPCNCTAALGEADACSILGDGQNPLLTVVASSPFTGVLMNGGAPASLTFNGVRGTVAGGGGEVAFTSPQSRRLQVTVNALGRVRLCSPDGSVGGYSCN